MKPSIGHKMMRSVMPQAVRDGEPGVVTGQRKQERLNGRNLE